MKSGADDFQKAAVKVSVNEKTRAAADEVN